ncbi:MAG: IPT/TIG domain-containing protein, partial [Chloroflexota bacterium]
MKANLNRVWRVVIALVLVLSIGMVTAPPVAAAPAATFSPTSGPIGTSVTVSGTGWTALENILSVTVGGATAAKTLTVNSSGAISGTITIPSVSGGAKNIIITGA